jgi:hypothetical protein
LWAEFTYYLHAKFTRTSDRIGILKKYAYGPDRTRTVQIRVWSGTYASCIHVL